MGKVTKADRIKTEKAIIVLLKEIDKLYRTYAPNGKYLSLSIIENASSRSYSVNNDYNETDALAPIDFTVFDGHDGHMSTYRSEDKL